MYLRLQKIRYSAYKNKISHLYHMIIQLAGSITVHIFLILHFLRPWVPLVVECELLMEQW